MEIIIISVLLIVIGFMYNNKREADDREKVRNDPGFLERRKLKNRIIARLSHIADEQKREVDKAIKKGVKISFWTHTHPKKVGHYEVKYQEDDAFHLRLRDPDYSILFYQSVLHPNEMGFYDYDDTYVSPELIKTTAYWDGRSYNVKNVRYYRFEM